MDAQGAFNWKPRFSRYMPNGHAAAVLSGERLFGSTPSSSAYRRQSAGKLDMPPALAEATGPEQGLAVLDAVDWDVVSAYQPYWAVRAHLLQRLERIADASDAYDRAIGLAEDPAIRQFLLKKRADVFFGAL
jgi:hypothetical protein